MLIETILSATTLTVITVILINETLGDGYELYDDWGVGVALGSGHGDSCRLGLRLRI